MSEKWQWDDNTIGRVFGIIGETLYSIALYRSINPEKRETKIYDPYLRRFWITISNNAILMAIINWCKVFGAKKNNETHYSHFVNLERFMSNLNEFQFKEFSEQMLNVRDRFAAHEDPISKRGKIPDFDIAMQIMEAFRITVQEEYDIPELPPVSTTYTAYLLQIHDCLVQCKTDWEIIEPTE